MLGIVRLWKRHKLRRLGRRVATVESKLLPYKIDLAVSPAITVPDSFRVEEAAKVFAYRKKKLKHEIHLLEIQVLKNQLSKN